MGTPAQVDNGIIYFDTEEQRASGLKILQQWIKNVESGNCDESLKGDYSIYKMEHAGHCIYFKAESERVQNLEWQMKNLCNAAKELEGCAEFSADIVIMEPINTIAWSKDNELVAYEL